MNPRQVAKLITFGQMALEQGWYDQARDYFEQALALDASNQEAMKGLARVNEILSRRMATPVEPTRAEPVEPLRKVSLEPIKPEVEPAKPKPGLKLATMQRGRRRWLALALIPVLLLVFVFAYQRVVPVLLPAPTPTSTPTRVPTVTPWPTSTPTRVPTVTPRPRQREDFLVYKEQAFRLLSEWLDAQEVVGGNLRWTLAGPVAELQRIHREWKDLDPPAVAVPFHRYELDHQEEWIARCLEFMREGKQPDWTKAQGYWDKVNDIGWELFGDDWASW